MKEIYHVKQIQELYEPSRGKQLCPARGKNCNKGAGLMQERTERTYEVTELVSVDPSAVQEESQDDQSQSSTEGPAKTPLSR